jgi:ABC-type multidrug transport system fused ATPase/permease subunit
MGFLHKPIKQFLCPILQMIRLAWQAQPFLLVAFILLDLVQGLAPLATAWLTKLLFDLLAQGLQPGAGRSLAAPIIFILVAQALVALFSYALGLPSSYSRAELGRKLTLHVQQTVYRQINRFAGPRYFEDPAFHDTVSLGNRGAGQGPTQTVQNFSNLLRSLAVLVSFIGVLLLFNRWLALAVIVAVLPHLYTQIQIGRQRFRLAVANTFRQRQMSYYGSLLSNEHYVKEVRLFSLADWCFWQGENATIGRAKSQHFGLIAFLAAEQSVSKRPAKMSPHCTIIGAVTLRSAVISHECTGLVQGWLQLGWDHAGPVSAALVSQHIRHRQQRSGQPGRHYLCPGRHQ